MQEKITLEALLEAYQDCRKSKRKTHNALKFEVDYESNLIQLCRDINTGSYVIGRSTAFILTRPVLREIFAADFRDRVVHHLLINKINSLFERHFIYDSYACRKNKGTFFGVKRVAQFIRKCSENYTRDCYILKLDIKGFFMAINRKILFNILCPGFIETPMVTGQCKINPKLRKRFLQCHPNGRFGKTSEIANALVYLLSDESKFMIGHTMTLDGGLTI